MTEQQKKKTANLEDLQAFVRIIHNKGIGTKATCLTAAATAAKQAVAGTTFSLTPGAMLVVTFQNAISADNATLALGSPVDATAEDYSEKNPATEGWQELSSGAFVATADTEPQQGKTYYVVSTAKPIYFQGAALEADVVKAGISLLLFYDGTSYNIVGGMGNGQTEVEIGDTAPTEDVKIFVDEDADPSVSLNVYTRGQIDNMLAIRYNPTTKAMEFPTDTSRVEYDPTTKGMVYHSASNS